MSATATAPATAEQDPAPSTAPAKTRRRGADLLFTLAALLIAGYVTNGLWLNPYTNVLAENVGDQAFFEWVLGYGVHLLRDGGNPFFTTLLNAPAGVNLAANTSITVYAILFAPLTILAGPQVSFATILTLNLACSAIAWYLFLGRWITRSRAAAALGGLFCGFAPGFVAHANGHLNWTSGWIAPVVLWALLKLREKGRWLRNGLLLGLLLGACFTIAAEGLFFTALAGGLFIIVWSLSRATWGEARAALPTVLAGLSVAGVVAFVLLAYPLYMHFAGPQTFSGTGFNQRQYSEDLGAFVNYAERSYAARAGLNYDLAPNHTEQTSFFGPVLPILIVVIGVILWRRADAGRRATLRALFVVALVFFVVSLGPRLKVYRDETYIPLPYALLERLPLFDSALPLRFALVLVGVFGVLLAMAAGTLMRGKARAVLGAAFALALVPLFPLPLLTSQRAPEPHFISAGTWKQFVPPGAAMSALPFALNVAADGQRWQAYTMARGGRQFRIPDGYFLGPTAKGRHDTGRLGAIPRRTDWVLMRAALYGYVPNLSDKDRTNARADFKRWNITAVFLPDKITGPDGPLFRTAVELTATDLLGSPPERVDDVLVWRIRPGIDPVDKSPVDKN